MAVASNHIFYAQFIGNVHQLSIIALLLRIAMRLILNIIVVAKQEFILIGYLFSLQETACLQSACQLPCHASGQAN